MSSTTGDNKSINWFSSLSTSGKVWLIIGLTIAFILLVVGTVFLIKAIYLFSLPVYVHSFVINDSLTLFVVGKVVFNGQDKLAVPCFQHHLLQRELYDNDKNKNYVACNLKNVECSFTM